MNPSSKIIALAGLILLPALRAQAQYLDFSQPARATAMGGNLVALPEGPSAMVFNPAGLAHQERFEIDARYAGLYQGLENDSLSTGNLTALSAPTAFGVFGGAWDHLGSNLLAQDLFRLAWGREIPVGGFLDGIGVGFSLSFLTESYTLLTPIAGVSLNQLSPSAFSFGGGLLMDLNGGLSLGFSVDNLNEPNLGVVGIDRVPALYRWGVGWKLFTRNPVQLTLTASQSLSGSLLDSCGGAELLFPNYGAKIRCGMDTYQGSIGFGYELADFSLDYAYSFSVHGYTAVSQASLPPSQQLDLRFQWGAVPAQAAYDTFLRKAREGEVQGRWGKANWYYQECLSMAPGDPAATLGRKRTLVRMNSQRARKWYQDGRTALQRNLPTDARNDFEMALQLAPGRPEYGQALAEAVARVKKQENEQDVAGAIRQASEWIGRNDPREALRTVDDALQKHPGNAALQLVQSSLSQTGEPAGAPAKNGTANQNAKLDAAEADLFLAHGQTALAKESLEKALKAQPQNIAVKIKLIRLQAPPPTVSPEKARLAQDLYDKGLQNYLEGKLAEAIRDWEDAAEADPTNTKVQNDLVRAKIERKMENP